LLFLPKNSRFCPENHIGQTLAQTYFETKQMGLDYYFQIEKNDNSKLSLFLFPNYTTKSENKKNPKQIQ
jgi:hypothetical protein